MRDSLKKAFEFRHACKLFDSEKKISKEDLDFILETSALSPSSFGMEGSRLIIVQSQDLKEQLQITTTMLESTTN